MTQSPCHSVLKGKIAAKASLARASKSAGNRAKTIGNVNKTACTQTNQSKTKTTKTVLVTEKIASGRNTDRTALLPEPYPTTKPREGRY
jgi:hypothetical protein